MSATEFAWKYAPTCGGHWYLCHHRKFCPPMQDFDCHSHARCLCKFIGYVLLFVIAIWISDIEIHSAIEAGSSALQGDGWHLRSDGILYPFLAITTLMVMWKKKHYEVIQRIAGIIVALILIVLGIIMLVTAFFQIYNGVYPTIDTGIMLEGALWGLGGNTVMLVIMLGLDIDHHGSADDHHHDKAHSGGLRHLLLDTLGSVFATANAWTMGAGFTKTNWETYTTVSIGCLLIWAGIDLLSDHKDDRH